MVYDVVYFIRIPLLWLRVLCFNIIELFVSMKHWINCVILSRRVCRYRQQGRWSIHQMGCHVGWKIWPGETCHCDSWDRRLFCVFEDCFKLPWRGQRRKLQEVLCTAAHLEQRVQQDRNPDGGLGQHSMHSTGVPEFLCGAAFWVVEGWSCKCVDWSGLRTHHKVIIWCLSYRE